MRRLRLKDHNAHMSLHAHCLGIVSRVSSLAMADRRAAWLGALQVGESGLCGDTVASRTPRTLGLPSDLRSFLCKMGPAVTVSFHERQYCITNGSLGLTKAKKYVPWETFTHLGRGTHVQMAGRQGLGMFWFHFWIGVTFGRISWNLRSSFTSRPFPYTPFPSCWSFKNGAYELFSFALFQCLVLCFLGMSWGKIKWHAVLVDNSHCNDYFCKWLLATRGKKVTYNFRKTGEST